MKLSTALSMLFSYLPTQITHNINTPSADPKACGGAGSRRWARHAAVACCEICGRAGVPQAHMRSRTSRYEQICARMSMLHTREQRRGAPPPLPSSLNMACQTQRTTVTTYRHHCQYTHPTTANTQTTTATVNGPAATTANTATTAKKTTSRARTPHAPRTHPARTVDARTYSGLDSDLEPSLSADLKTFFALTCGKQRCTFSYF